MLFEVRLWSNFNCQYYSNIHTEPCLCQRSHNVLRLQLRFDWYDIQMNKKTELASQMNILLSLCGPPGPSGLRVTQMLSVVLIVSVV